LGRAVFRPGGADSVAQDAAGSWPTGGVEAAGGESGASASGALATGEFELVGAGVVDILPAESGGAAASCAAVGGCQPAGGATCTMLLHLGQLRICPIAARSRTLSRARQVGQAMANNSTMNALVDGGRSIRQLQIPVVVCRRGSWPLPAW
jgi:hypothetical protein